MSQTKQIHKAAGILIIGRKFLITRSKGKTYFVSPGGKLEDNETSPIALIRELNEELRITVTVNNLEAFGTFEAISTGTDDTKIVMDVFFVRRWTGDIVPSNEVEEVRWIDSSLPEDFELGSIFKTMVLPRLKELDLID